jgi:hypothetical protein
MPPFDHRSSIIDHRSSIIDHRSSIIDHRSSIIGTGVQDRVAREAGFFQKNWLGRRAPGGGGLPGEVPPKSRRSPNRRNASMRRVISSQATFLHR